MESEQSAASCLEFKKGSTEVFPHPEFLGCGGWKWVQEYYLEEKNFEGSRGVIAAEEGLTAMAGTGEGNAYTDCAGYKGGHLAE